MASGAGLMTGPEFYKAAAETLDDAEGRIGDCTPGESAIALAMIGVGRATLAVAASMAAPWDEDAWKQVTR